MTPSTQPGAVRRASWLASPAPTTAVEICLTHVSAVAVSRQDRGAVITGFATEPLVGGAIEPGLNAPNVHDPAALTQAVGAVLDKLPVRPTRIALVLPDTVAKVALVRFEKVPAKMQDLDQLIRWQVRKATPFKIEDAQVSWLPGVELEDGGQEFVVTVARRDVVTAYEEACGAAGVHPGIVDLSSFNVINTVLATAAPATAGDWLLVHVAEDYTTLAVARGPHLVFFRNRGGAVPAELVDLVHQTAMYHEDRLGGGGFTRVVLAGAALLGAEHGRAARSGLEERLGTRVEPLDFRATVPMRDRISAGAELLDGMAPALGALLRDQVA